MIPLIIMGSTEEQTSKIVSIKFLEKWNILYNISRIKINEYKRFKTSYSH